MEKPNADIRSLLERRRVRFWEVAFAMGVSPETFSRWLRKELDAERKEEITNVINNIKI